MKIPIGKHGNITQTMPNDTSARARRARSSYKFKNATSPWREWRYPMKVVKFTTNPYFVQEKSTYQLDWKFSSIVPFSNSETLAETVKKLG